MAPPSTAQITAMEVRSMESATTLKVRAEMPQTPAARPSRPSMKLTMLMIAATQTKVKRMESHSGRW